MFVTQCFLKIVWHLHRKLVGDGLDINLIDEHLRNKLKGKGKVILKLIRTPEKYTPNLKQTPAESETDNYHKQEFNEHFVT